MANFHSGQVAAWNVPGRYKAIRCGRRWGKTSLAATIICDRVARGESWGLFAPDYKITSETYREIYEILDPITVSASKTDGVIRVLGGGRVDFWTLNNPRAGRSRKYHGVMIDEAAFAGPDMQMIWERSIKPALLDHRGVGWALSTPAGKDEGNWFYNICTDPAHGFVEFHAPTASNPYLPQDELARLQRDNSPEVYRQEYLAEFVDWSGVAFFAIDALLVDGAPTQIPTRCDTVFATVDTAIKSGLEHDATGAVFWAYSALSRPSVHILDWDILQIEGAALEGWLPSVYARLEELSRECNALRGTIGVLIEDKASGTVLLQQAKNRGWPAFAIESKLTSMGKNERAIAASPYVFRGDIKITDKAYHKTKVHRGRSANHLISQITNFRIGSQDRASDDLLDCFCYGIAMSCGNGNGDRRGI